MSDNVQMPPTEPAHQLSLHQRRLRGLTAMLATLGEWCMAVQREMRTTDDWIEPDSVPLEASRACLQAIAAAIRRDVAAVREVLRQALRVIEEAKAREVEEGAMAAEWCQ